MNKNNEILVAVYFVWGHKSRPLVLLRETGATNRTRECRGGVVPACREARGRDVLEYLRGFEPPLKKMQCIFKISLLSKLKSVMRLSIIIDQWP